VIEAEKELGFTSVPIDIADFQRKQATFRAMRLSPEDAETFFRQAVPFVGGAIKEFTAKTEEGEFPVFQVNLPNEFVGKHSNRLTVSFWPPACSDDETDPEAALFISPGHWLFELLLEQVASTCRPDLEHGAAFYDLHPDTSYPYLIWFATAHVQDGLGRSAGEKLAALRHQADSEQVRPLPLEILEGFKACSHALAQDCIPWFSQCLQLKKRCWNSVCRINSTRLGSSAYERKTLLVVTAA
jgi:hypothetical protein